MNAIDSLEVYRLLTGVIIPRPIAWISTLGEGGVINIAPFSYFNIMGADPPIVAIGIGNRRDGSPKDTAANILRNDDFVINLVDEAVAPAMNITAIDFPLGTSELTEANLTAEPSRQVSTPRVAEARIHLECRLEKALEIGANRIILGRVLHVHVRDVDTLENWNPIGRLNGGGWYTRTTERFDMPRILLRDWQELSEKNAKEQNGR